MVNFGGAASRHDQRLPEPGPVRDVIGPVGDVVHSGSRPGRRPQVRSARFHGAARNAAIGIVRRLVELPEQLLARAATQGGLVSTADCDELAVSRDRRTTLVARGTWTRVTTGVYDVLPALRHELAGQQRAVRAAWAALLAYGPEAVAVGMSACALLGIEGLPLTPTAEAALPGGRSARDRDGILLRQYDAGMRTVEVEGRLVAAPAWALAQAVPRLGRGAAVSVMDSAQHLKLLDATGLAHAHDLARRRRGVDRTHDWWSMSDGRAESPLETRGRLDCRDVGVDPDDLQVEIFDALGILLGIGDLGWKQNSGRWLIAEMDGREPHELPRALLHDRSRQNDFVTSGEADVLRFTWRDVGSHHRMGRAVRRFLGR